MYISPKPVSIIHNTITNVKQQATIDSANVTIIPATDSLIRSFFMELWATADTKSAYVYWWSKATKHSEWFAVSDLYKMELPRGTDIFFGIHPARMIGNQNTRAKGDDILCVGSLYADFDFKDFDSPQATIAHITDATDFPPPSVIINSGGGYHCYWLLNKVHHINGEADFGLITDIQRRWVEFVGGDMGARDLTRMLRVPGTINSKYDSKPPISFVQCCLDSQYDRDGLAELLPAPVVETNDTIALHPLEIPSETLSQATNAKSSLPEPYVSTVYNNEIKKLLAATEGNRNSALNTTALKIGHYVPQYLTEATVIESLRAVAMAIGLEDLETEATIASGLKKGMSEPKTIPDRQPGGVWAVGAAVTDEKVTLFNWPVAKNNSDITFCNFGDDGTTRIDIGEPERIKRLNNAGYAFTLNTMEKRIYLNDAPLNDFARSELHARRRNGFSKGSTESWDNTFSVAAQQNQFHPLRDYFTALTWDGKNHISELCKLIDTPDSDYTLAAISTWAVNAIRRVFHSVQNPVLVLSGLTNIGKSYLARWLGVKPEWFVEGALQPDNKDHQIAACTHFVWELSELASTTRRTDMNALKSHLTQFQFTLRLPYGRFEQQMPHVTSYIGTVNPQGSGFLVDPTGNRRFVIVDVDAINYRQYKDISPDGFWATAYQWYLNKTNYELPAAFQQQAANKNENALRENINLARIQKHYEILPEDEIAKLLDMGQWRASNTFATLADVMTIIGVDNLRQNQMDIADALRELGCVKIRARLDGKQDRIWVGCKRRL